MPVQETGEGSILIVGGTGKTGRRVAKRLEAQGIQTRRASRSSDTRFDWEDETTWLRALEGVSAAYITYAPDLALPGAAEHVRTFTALAVQNGVRRLVLLSGRGEAGAVASEEALKASGADWTILRASWFSQNFSEAFMLEGIRAGELSLPASDIPEPFTDVEDIADVAQAVLTEPGHSSKTYELTGPHAFTFAEAVAEIARATGREICYTRITPEAFAAALEGEGLPELERGLLLELFTQVLDGRIAQPQDGVRHVLGRDATSFGEYVQRTAATGVWNA